MTDPDGLSERLQALSDAATEVGRLLANVEGASSPSTADAAIRAFMVYALDHLRPLLEAVRSGALVEPVPNGDGAERLLSIAHSRGDDLWNELENLRHHWHGERAGLIAGYVEQWEAFQAMHDEWLRDKSAAGALVEPAPPDHADLIARLREMEAMTSPDRWSWSFLGACNIVLSEAADALAAIERREAAPTALERLAATGELDGIDLSFDFRPGEWVWVVTSGTATSTGPTPDASLLALADLVAPVQGPPTVPSSPDGGAT